MNIRIALLGLISLFMSIGSFAQDELVSYNVFSFKNTGLPDTVYTLLDSELSDIVDHTKNGVNENSPFFLIGIIESLNTTVGLDKKPETSVQCKLTVSIFNVLTGEFSEGENFKINGKGKDDLSAYVNSLSQIKGLESSISMHITESERSLIESFVFNCSDIVERTERLRELGNPIQVLNYFNQIPRDGWDCKILLSEAGGQYYEEFVAETSVVLKEKLMEAIDRKDKKEVQDIYSAMTYVPHCEEPMAELAERVTSIGVNAEAIMSKVNDNQIRYEEIPLEKWGGKLEIINLKVIPNLERSPIIDEYFNNQIQDWLSEEKK